MRSLLLSGTAGLLILSPVAFAQDIGVSAEATATTAPEVVVTATRIEQPIDRMPASVTVIDREEIERKGYVTVQDALRSVPGLTVVQNGGLGTQASVLMRGTSFNNTLVLIDGVPVNDPGGLDTFDFGVDLLGDVERIEVVRGPGAALHGNNAAGGVINIITRSGAGEPDQIYGSVAVGNRSTAEGLAGISGSQGAFHYNLSLQGVTTGGYNITPDRRSPNFGEEDGFWNSTFTASAGYDLTDTASVDGLLRVRRSETEVDDGGVDDPNRENTSDQTLWRLGGEVRSFDGALTSRLDIGQVIYERTDDDPPNPGDLFPPDDRFDSRRSYADFQNTYDAGRVGGIEDLTLVAGVEVARESIDVESGGHFEEAEDTAGYYAQAQGTVFDAVDLTLAGRITDNENFDTKGTYRAGAAWRFDETGTRLLGSVGTAYRIPSLSERFAPFGNPELEPENSFSWEVGIEQDLELAGRDDFLTVGATYFRTSIDDKIDFDFATSTTRNINEAEIEGVESFATLRPLDWLEATLSYTWTNTRDVMDDRPLSGVPKHKVALTASASPTDAWTIAPEIVYASKQFNFIYPDGAGFGAVGYNDGYTVVNVATTYQFNETYQLFGRIENLLDHEYETPNGFLAPGFTALAGIRASY